MASRVATSQLKEPRVMPLARVLENLPPCHLPIYQVVLHVAVSPTILLPYVWIAIPCKFWEICHHTTCLSIRQSYVALPYVWIAIPCKFGKICHHATYLYISQCYLLQLQVWIVIPCKFWINVPPCHLSIWQVVQCVQNAISCKFWINLPPCHLSIYMCVLLSPAILRKICHHATNI